MEFRVIEDRDIEACAAIVGKVFSEREVLCSTEGVSLAVMTEFARAFLIANIPLKLSHLAEYEGKIVGCACVELMTSPAPAWSEEVLEKFKNILAGIRELH
jgi:hypothetical protein